MQHAKWVVIAALLLSGCGRWDAKAPEETKVGQAPVQVPDSMVRAEISVNTRQFEQDLLARYANEPLHAGETPWVNEHLHVTKKTIGERLEDVVVTPYKAAECTVKKVPGQCVKRVWESCFKKFRPWKCLGGWVNVQYGCLVDFQECAPEIKAVIESRLMPFEILKDEIAPTEMRVRYDVKLRTADVDASDGALSVKAGVRLNLKYDLKQGLLGKDVTVKGLLACSSDFLVSAAAKIAVNPGPAIDLTLTDFGFDVQKACIPGAVELADLTLANPSVYLTKEILGRALKKILVDVLDKQLDKQLADDLNLAGDVGRAIEKIREPIKLGRRDLWLQVNPRKAWVSQFTATGSGDANRLVARVAVQAAPAVVFGEKPSASAPPKPFPVEVGDAIGREFSLSARGTVPLKSAADTLSAALQRALDEKNPDVGLVTGPVRIYQSGPRFVVGVTFLKRSDRKEVGTVYLAGMPVLDQEQRAVRLKDVAFDVDSRRVLLKSANWLLSGVVEQVIERVPFNYGGLLVEVEKAAGVRPTDPPEGNGIATDAIYIEESGEYRHQAKDLLLIGKLHKVDVSGIWVADGAMHVSAVASGRLDLHFRPRL